MSSQENNVASTTQPTTKETKPTILCPVQHTLSLIGGKHKVLILWNLYKKTLRYSEIQRLVPAATPKMLTQQLRELETDGLISRYVYQQVPPRVDYSLTPLGESLKPILTALYHWGMNHLEGQGLCPNCSMVLHADENEILKQSSHQPNKLDFGTQQITHKKCPHCG